MGTPLASSVFLSIILMEGYTSSVAGLVLAVLISTLLTSLVALSYGELVSIYPSAAGNRVFLKRPMGDVASLTISFMWTVVILGAAGVEAYVLGNVLHFLVPEIPALAWSVISLTAILAINVVGVEISGNVQMGLTFFIAAALAAVSAVAIATPHSNRVVGQGVDLAGSLTASAVGVYFFLGFDRVTTLGEEAVDFKKGIPRAMPVGVLLLGAVFLLVSSAVLVRVPLAAVASSPVPQILLGKYMLNDAYATLMAAISVLMSFGAFNAGLLGTSRLIYALGREGTLPRFLGKISPRFFTPVPALLFLYVVVLVFTLAVYLTKSFTVPIVVAALYNSFVYAFVAYSALWHHRKLGPEETPFRVKGGTALFAATATVFGFLGLLLAASYPLAAALTAAGLVVCAAYFRLVLRKAGAQKTQRRLSGNV